MKKRILYIMVILILGLVLPVTSCNSNKVQPDEQNISIVVWPDFPKLESYTITGDNQIIIPYEFFLDLAEFKVDYQCAVNLYNDIEKLKEERK